MEWLLHSKSVQAGSVDQNGWTPFLGAAACSPVDYLQRLISTGRYDSNHIDRSNRYALLYTAEEGSREVVKALPQD